MDTKISVIIRGGSREFCLGGGANYGERGSASLYGGLGACPSGVQGQSPWSGGHGDKVPLKLTRFCNFKFKFLMKNAPFLRKSSPTAVTQCH